MSRRKRLSSQERCDIYRVIDAIVVIADAEVVHGMTPEEITFLVGVDVETVRQIDQLEDVDLSMAETIANRLANLTAHDRLRLAAFRAKQEVAP